MNPIIFWKEHNLKNFIDRGGVISPDEIDHIVDWLKSEDSKKYHRQISKLSVSDALKLSNEWTKSLIKKATDQESSTDVEQVMTFDDGFFVVKLLTKQAYIREGLFMGHCVGGYDPKAQIIYSLRDSSNRPHATIELSFDNEIQQIQGKGNKPVVRKYHKYIQKFLTKNIKFNLLNLDNYVLPKIGLLKHENKIYDLYNLPKDPLVFNEDLYLSGLELTEIPNIICYARLDLSRNEITKIPDDFIQTGYLELDYNQIKEIPDNFKQNDFLSLSNNQITKISDNFIQNGELDLSNNQITKIPDNFTQNSFLDLSYNQIKEIPKNFKQSAVLRLDNNQITEIPNDFVQFGSLNLSYNKITKIPDNFFQNGYLNLSNNQIIKIPNGFKQKGPIDLSNNLINKMPINFIKNDFLNLTGNKITLNLVKF